MRIQDIKTRPPFSDLFDIDENVLDAISENIRLEGFDVSQPIVIWQGKDTVIDGHTRLAAAKKAGVVNIITCTKPFADEQSALSYAIHNQRNRRNLTEAELLRCIEAVDKVKERGGDRKSEEAKSKGSSELIDSATQTAAIVGTSASKVKKARKVKKENPEAHEEVKAGKKTINKAYQETVAKSKSPPSTEPIVTDKEACQQERILRMLDAVMPWRKEAVQYPEFKEIVWDIDAAKEKYSK